MGYVATFDAGTTAVKAVLTTEDGGIVVSCTSEDIPLSTRGGMQEQNPHDWWKALLQTTREMLRQAAQSRSAFDTSDILGVIMSGQMQDVIMLDENLTPVRPAILYADGRAGLEARQMAQTVGAERFRDLTGNQLEGSLPLPKLMWLKRHEPGNFARTRHVLFDAKDYLIARLAHTLCADVVASSTVGAMDIRRRLWSDALIDAAGLEAALFPPLHNPQDLVGEITDQAARETGFARGTPVFAGIGDAGATTFASGVTRTGQYNIHIGTSGWIATISAAPIIDRTGVANLACTTSTNGPDAAKQDVINGVPFLNAGNVHRWATSVFAKRPDDYAGMSALLNDSVPGSHGVLCLPYLSGERFPVMNAAVRGAYIGISSDTTPADMARAALEGVAFSIRQGLETFDVEPENITLIGGGARERIWCQIMADVLGHPIEVFRNADVLPAAALTLLAGYSLGRIGSFPEVERLLRDRRAYTGYEPRVHDAFRYDDAYARYRMLYPSIAGLTETASGATSSPASAGARHTRHA